MATTPSSLLDITPQTTPASSAPIQSSSAPSANTLAEMSALGMGSSSNNTNSTSSSILGQTVGVPNTSYASPVNTVAQQNGQSYVDANGVTIPAAQTTPTSQSNYTLNGVTYNAQGEVVSGSNNGTVQASTQNTQPANNGVLATGTQTYKLGDGSIYDSNGNLISQSGQNITSSGGDNISAGSPDTTTNSSSLGQSPGDSEILQSLNDSYTNEQNLFANLQQYATVPASEQQLQSQVASDQAKVQGLQYQAEGLYNPGNQTIAAHFLTGQAQNQMVSAQLQSTIDQASLAYAQGNRQFAFNSASTIYNASRNNLADMISIYQATAPKNVSTNYNPLTGAVNTTMINPLTGETYEVDNGNIGASQPIQNVSSQVNPLTGQLTIVGTDATGQPVTYSMNSNGQITGNSLQGSSSSSTQSGTPGSLVSPNINPQAVVGGYDLTSYAGASSATGSYGSTVNGIYQNMPSISNSQDAQSYISSIAPNSPITGQMVMNAAQQYGVNPQVMMAVMQEESSMGTAGMATSTFNPGNVGNNSDSGKSTNWGSWQAGVNAVAHNLSERQINPVQTASTGSNISGASSPQQVIQQVVASLPPTISQAVNYLPDGTPYIDGNLVNPSLATAAETQGQAVGIKYIDPNSASKLQTITTTQADLADFKTKADASLSSVGWGAQYLNWAGLALGNLGGSTTLNDFQSYRTSAISALESLASGAGSGFRITQGELNTAIDNVPTTTDTKAQADEKITALNTQMNNWIATIYPGWIPPTS